MPNYKFTSTKDMTTQEVADLMQVMIVSLLQAMQQRQPTGDEPLEIDDIIYNHLPSNLKQYFSPQKLESDNVPNSDQVNPHEGGGGTGPY